MRGEYRIGVDVGGTNTDAVLLDDELQLVAKAKTPTTENVDEGLAAAIQMVLSASGVVPASVSRVMLGTTHATNAVLQRRDLASVAVIRIGGPATRSVPPLSTWPADLRKVVSAGEIIVDGGFEFDGREHVPFDEPDLRRFLEDLPERPEACAITSTFSPVSAEHEHIAAAVVADVFGQDTPVSLSCDIGSIGILERENACVLNAALRRVARQIADGLSTVLREQAIEATPFFAQNDGTLMALERVLEFPVLTVGSGPANSMRGAAYLTGLRDAIVVDVGGTSTDIGVLANGFPRESAIPVEIGGVRTNSRMPDLLSIALGGGTRVRGDGDDLEIGHDSVGYRLTSEALCFGGPMITLSDMTVRAGRASMGTHPVDAVSESQAAEAIARVDAMFEDAVDRMKLARSEQPAIAVGGGSVLLPNSLAGVSEVHRPDNYEVANAIGAAIASISAEVDQLLTLGPGGREEAIKKARDAAIGSAIALGAEPERTEIVALEELTMAYLKDNVLRLRVKAAGPLL
ncbi:hydantoinase/oxoprolinase N-terminal domain-containing protein [Candidatus Poriferisodalis sp.]|uniref:hydantoinase/oxoprolinase N-terminal domain-containing protein n=1 Tax=Candidatus Poriferisodalis sp. TaxID=3101277 RepID=UPI003B01909E